MLKNSKQVLLSIMCLTSLLLADEFPGVSIPLTPGNESQSNSSPQNSAASDVSNPLPQSDEATDVSNPSPPNDKASDISEPLPQSDEATDVSNPSPQNDKATDGSNPLQDNEAPDNLLPQSDEASDALTYPDTIKTTLIEADETRDDCCFSPRPERIMLRHIEAKGVGYDQGYTTLEGFFTVPSLIDTEWVPFLDLRGHVFNDGKKAANAGLGLRYLSLSHVWGINSYYDYRRTKRLKLNQWGLGLECLGRVFDFRLNGYLPVGKKESRFYQTKFDHFRGHSLLLSRKRELAFKGVNAEVGVHAKLSQQVYLYSAAGPYYLAHKSRHTWGGELRLALDFTKYITVEGNVSYDTIFKTIGQGQLSLNIPFGGRKKIRPRNCNSCSKELMLRDRALQRVDRDEIIVVEKRRTTTKAIDPATGFPFFFIFVDNRSGGNGTFENPYPTLTLAEANSAPGNYILVSSGNGSPYLNQPITLKDGQKLWGTGISYVIQTKQGVVTIPALSPAFPQINTTVTSPAVTLGNGCEVAGLNFSLFNGPAIQGGDPALLTLGITNTNIHHNFFSAGSSETVLLNNCQGKLQISNNQITNVDNGIIIVNQNVLVNSSTEILNNNISFSVNEGLGFVASSSSGQMNLLIANNTVTNCLAEMILEGTPGSAQTVCATIQDNIFANSTVNFGLELLTTSPSDLFLVNLIGNTFTGNTLGGFGVTMLAGTNCISLNKNVSENNNGNPGYTFNNIGGVINVEDFANLTTNNIGTVSQTGVVNSVPVGACGCQ